MKKIKLTLPPFKRVPRDVVVKLRPLDEYRFFSVQQEIQTRFLECKEKFSKTHLLRKMEDDIERVLYKEPIAFFEPSTFDAWKRADLDTRAFDLYRWLKIFSIVDRNGHLKCPTVNLEGIQIMDAYLEGLAAFDKKVELEKLHRKIGYCLVRQLNHHNQLNTLFLNNMINEANCLADQLFPHDINIQCKPQK